MSLFLPLDVEYASDEEFIEAGPMAELLFIRANCFIKRKRLDGVIKKSQLALFSQGIPQPKRAVRALIEVGLWEERGETWTVPSYLKRNPSKKEIETKAELAKESGEFGAHERWHVQEGRKSSKCRYCIAERMGTPIDPPNGVGWPETEPSTEPEPQPEPEPEPEPITPTDSSSSNLYPATPSTTTNEKDPRFEIVIGLIVDADIAEHGNPRRANPERYRATCINTLLTQRGPEIRQALADRPDATPEHVAGLMRSPR